MQVLMILGIASLATAAYLVAETVTAPARQRTVSVRRAASYGKVRLAARPGNEQFTERVLTPLKHKLAGWVLKLNPRATVESVSAKLLAAGMNRTVTPIGFLAMKAALSVSGIVMGSLFGAVAAGFGGTILCALLFGGALFMLPDVAISFKARARREAVRSELPDALDLLAVSVEAGLGFDAAIAKLTERMKGSLADEFALTLNEMRIGESRQDALKRMSDRVPAP